MLPRALEAIWVPVLDAVLAELRAPKLAETSRLAPKLVALSKAYNTGVAGQEAALPLPLEARVAFSFARDVPKAAGAVRELVASGALALPPDRPLRILDLGAGLGAMTWGIVRALEASGARGDVTSLLVDEDAKALAAASSIARVAATKLGPQPVTLKIETRTGRVSAPMGLGRYDVVVLGQVLSEMDRAADGGARIASHAAVLRDLVESALELDGSLVVVEPALRDRSRHLHAVRDRVLGDAGANVTLFAPCLHRETCPALANDGDWCHDDLAVDLPPWLVPLARAAGLRYQGLTFAYLVLRRDARSLARELGENPSRVHLRVVSDRFVTKGKQELFGCTHEGKRVRLRLLDRDVASHNDVWTTLARGDIASLTATDEPPIDERGRISPHAAIDARRMAKL